MTEDMGDKLDRQWKKRYKVHSMFATIQGEGYHAGTPAVFVRLSGCNVWSGKEEDRKKDTKRGLCAAWCDTDFFGIDEDQGGGNMRAGEIAVKANGAWLRGMGASDGAANSRVLVVTGGEPSLQLDTHFVYAMHQSGWLVHVETNGSRALPEGLDWVTLSPKPPMPVVAQRYDEVKCIVPAVDPAPYRNLVRGGMVFIQPLDSDNGIELRAKNWAAAVDYVIEHPWTRLSIQTHKLLGLP